MFSLRTLQWCNFKHLRFTKVIILNCRAHQSAAQDHNIKKIKLIKRLASTILFGGTFLTVIWAKKRKHLPVFDETKLITNSNYQKKFLLYEYKDYILPTFVLKNLGSVKDFLFRNDDILVVSFPKAGTTWLQEIIYCVMNGVNDSFPEGLEDRFPYLEFIYPGVSSIEKVEGQRYIKTHLPFSLLPENLQKTNTKIFYIMRNPKDIAVSYYHFVRMMTISAYSGNFDTFFQDFLSNKVPYGPIWKHYQEAWEMRDNPNVTLLFYEDLQKDIYGVIRKIAAFLNKDLTDKEVLNIVRHCSFKNMSQNPSVNYQHWDDWGIRKTDEAKFMRKGEVGDWKNYFTSEMNNSIDLWIEDNFKDIADCFIYDKIEE